MTVDNCCNTSGKTSIKPKWLAIHNFRSTPEVFKQQLAPVVDLLPNADVDFVQAPHPARADPQGFEWWSSPTFSNYMMGWIGDVGLDESMSFLREKVVNDGPYHGVIGFSQGAAMAHFVLSTGLVKRGLLFSPVLPLGRQWPPRDDGNYTAVVIRDPADLTGENYPLKGIEVVEHNENHTIPSLRSGMVEKILSVATL